MKKIVLLATVSLIAARQAGAVDVQPYVGADYVYSWANIEDSEYFRDRFQAINVSVGAMATSVMGVELSYQQSEQNKKSTAIGQTKIEYKVLALDGAYYVGLTEKFQVIGTAGLGYYELKGKLKNGGFLDHGDEGHYGLRFGLGMQYNIDTNWAVRMMGRYHYVDGDSLNHLTDITVGARYYF